MNSLNYFFAFAGIICLDFVRGDLKLQIVHTNDMHARYLEVDENTITCASDYQKLNKCYGGFARIRQAAIDAKDEARRQGIPSIFLNAGDTFQGTPYYTYSKWNITAAFVNDMEFDAICLGNHEFDDGIDNLVKYLTHISVPAVTTNLNFSTELRLTEKNVKKSMQFNIQGIEIAIVGYLTPDTMKSSETEDLQILDEIPSLKIETKRLKSAGAKVIIALGHSGFTKDCEIAKEVEDIDVIVGGHSHSLLHTPKGKPPSTETVEQTYPYWVTQNSGKKVPIVQASAFTKYIGKLTITMNDDGHVLQATGNTILLDHTHAKNIELDNKISQRLSPLKDRLQTVLANTRVSLKPSNLSDTNLESNFLNLITDAIIEKSVFIAKKKKIDQWTEHAVAYYLNSGIRAGIDHLRNGGNITVEDIMTAIPFQNQIYECNLPGSSIREALECSVEQYDHIRKKFQNFLHFSGMKVVYDLKKEPKNRVISAMIVCTNCSIPKYENLDENKRYRIIADSYILKISQNYSSIIGDKCNGIKRLDPSGLSASDIVKEYMNRHQIIYPKLDGRVQIRCSGGK